MDENKVLQQLNLPAGFRFHPTDEELVVHYLARKAAGKPFPIPLIAELDLYKCDPWELPSKALFGDKEWYFFSPRDRKYPNGARPNRAAGSGYWKATGTDKPISSNGSSIKAGVKKALVFYRGKAPKGTKTNWIMHEYRLTPEVAKQQPAQKALSKKLDDWVLCRIYRKNGAGSKVAAAPKLEPEDESCLEEVLASLPDIDDSKICLPRIGSLSALLAADYARLAQQHQQQQQVRDGSISNNSDLDPVVDNSIGYDARTKNNAFQVYGSSTLRFPITEDEVQSSRRVPEYSSCHLNHGAVFQRVPPRYPLSGYYLQHQQQLS